MRTFNQADAIAAHIIERCAGDIRLALPLGLGKANTIVNALTKAAMADSSIKLSIFTALTLERPVPSSDLEKRFLGPAMDRLFGNYPELLYAKLLHENRLPENIEVHEFFLLAGKWKHVDAVQQNYISANYTHAYDYLVARKPNVVTQLLARKGVCYSLSSNTDISADLIADRKAGRMDFMMVGEINSALPYLGGETAELAEADIQALLDDPASDFELFSAVKRPVSLVEQAIGLHVSALIEDGGTLQIGIGSIGDGMAQALLVRHNSNDKFRRIVNENPFSEGGLERHQTRFEEGLYAVTEMLVAGLLELFLKGIVKREVDGAAIHAGFFVESRSFYQKLRELNENERSKIIMKPVSFTNQLYGDEEAKRTARVKARFANNAMMVTLLGAVISDGTGDGEVVSGVGGQFNFVTQAFALKDARAIITAKATRQSSGGLVSNIVWNYPHATIPRHLKDIVVTEYGIADLRGKSDAETIAALLAVTDSRFQDDLLKKAKAEGKIDAGYTIPEQFRNNTPERLNQWLSAYRADGTLPSYPFGTDFTDVEQRLLPALAKLKSVQSSKFKLLELLWHGIRQEAVPDEKNCLERMGLDNPSGPKQIAYALLLRAAIRTTVSVQ